MIYDFPFHLPTSKIIRETSKKTKIVPTTTAVLNHLAAMPDGWMVNGCFETEAEI